MSDPSGGKNRPVVLVVLPNRPFFGASLILVPALLYVRRKHPGARFIALANHATSALFKRWGLFDEIWRHDSEGGEPFGAFRRTLGLRLELLVNCRPRSTRLHLWTMLMRTKQRRCFAHGLGKWIDAESRPWDHERYKALTYLGLVGAGWQEHVGDLLADWAMIPASAPSGALLFIPSGTHQGKKWPLAGYLEIAQRWRRVQSGPVQVLAGPADPEVATWVATPAAQAAGITLVSGGLPTEAAAIRAAAVVVGNDCGPNHLAQLMDRPRVVLFSPKFGPGEWFRPSAHATFIRPSGPLSEVPVDQVWSAVQSVMAAVDSQRNHDAVCQVPPAVRNDG